MLKVSSQSSNAKERAVQLGASGLQFDSPNVKCGCDVEKVSVELRCVCCRPAVLSFASQTLYLISSSQRVSLCNNTISLFFYTRKNHDLLLTFFVSHVMASLMPIFLHSREPRAGEHDDFLFKTCDFFSCYGK